VLVSSKAPTDAGPVKFRFLNSYMPFTDELLDCLDDDVLIEVLRELIAEEEAQSEEEPTTRWVN